MTNPTPSSERAPYRCIKPHCPVRCDDCNHAIRSDNEAAMLVTDMLNVLAFDELGLPYEEGDCLIVDKARAWLARASLPAPTNATLYDPEDVAFKRPPYCGSGHCSCIECPFAAPSQDEGKTK